MSQSEYWANFMGKRLSRRRLLQAGAMAGTSLWVGSTLGCGGGASSTPAAGTGQTTAQAGGTPTPQRGGTLRVNLAIMEYAGFDPYITNNFVGPTYEKLVHHSPKRDKIVPALAQSWETPDDLTYIFKMQQGVKFQNVAPVNGRECTADDAKYSMERTLSEGAQYPWRPSFLSIDKVEAVDKYTLKITTKVPFAPLMNNMALMGDYVMPKEIVGSDNVATKAIGTGAFIFDRWDKGDKIVWKRNPDYRVAGHPYFDGVEYKWSADYTSLVAVFISDQADVATMYAQDTKTILSKRPKAQMYQASALSQYGFIFRQGFKPTDDVRVRQAMDLMVQRWEMCYRLAGGTGELFGGSPTGPINHSLENWAIPMSELTQRPGFMEKYPKAEALAQAKKLMADAGYANGFDIELLNTPEQYRDMICQMCQEWWKDIGIRVTIKQMDMTAFYATGLKGDFQLALWITGGGNPDPDAQLYSPLKSDSVNNWGKWNDPKLDKLLEDQRATLDVNKRKQIVLETQRYILDQVPRMFLYDWSTYTAMRENIHDLVPWAAATFAGWEDLHNAWFSK